MSSFKTNIYKNPTEFIENDKKVILKIKKYFIIIINFAIKPPARQYRIFPKFGSYSKFITTGSIDCSARVWLHDHDRLILLNITHQSILCAEQLNIRIAKLF